MNPSDCVADVLTGVNEKRDATSRSLTSHYERSSEWLSEAIQTCKRKILEGTGQEVAEPKRLKKSADKENAASSNVVVGKEEKKKKKRAVPASVKKGAAAAKKGADAAHPPGFLHVMSLKVIELKAELRQRKLDTTGLKKDLQKRLLKDIAAEESKRQQSKNVSAKPVSSSSSVKDGDGDVRMKDADTNENDSRRDSSKMDVDEDDARRTKASAKKEAQQDTTVGKSLLKSTAEFFSPSKISAKMHSAKKEEDAMEDSSVVANEPRRKPEPTQSGRKSLTDGLKKTASAILSASSPVRKAPSSKSKSTKSPFVKKALAAASPARKAPTAQSTKSPFVKGSSAAKSKAKVREAPKKGETQESRTLEQSSKPSESRSEPKNQSLNAASVPAIPNKLGSIDKNAGAATKEKRNKCKADRMARLAEIRGKSKPVASVAKSGAVKDLPVLSSSKALKLGSAKAKDSKNDRKVLLTAQMREKAAAGSKTQVPSKVPSSSKLTAAATKPTASATTVATSAQSQSVPKITSSPLAVIQHVKQVVPHASAAKSAKASSSKTKKKTAPRPDVLSPMSTYEMSDRDQSDSDSESESYHHRQKKKVPSWAQKQNLLPALENQYANANGQLDPETIFPPVVTCNLEDIFDQTKSRFKARSSSANWSKDGVTMNEIVSYKRTMGY